MASEHMVTLRLDDEHTEILDAVAAFERLKRSDVLRRALRHYAEHLGVLPKPRARRPRKAGSRG
ncbi:MAG TPA: ribbon-helix-helix protein, CopG family [Polyangiaceae bacterium]|nr:ribbon-helix-helix protein, CopG family [Polyangiaceae bacterium]